MADGKKTENRVDFWTAVGRLKTRDKIALLLGVVFAGTGAFMILFFAVSRMRITEFHFPQSDLRKSASMQTYRQTKNSSLNLLVQFKGSDYGCYVGKEPINENDYGAAFKYSDDVTLLVGVIDGVTVMEDDFYSHGVPSILGLSVDGTETYENGLYDKGYLNTFLIEYEAGKLTAGNRTFYLVSYLFPDMDRKLCMMALIEKKDLQKFLDSHELLNQVYFGMVRFEDKTEEEIAEETKKQTSRIELEDDSSLSTDERLARIQEKVEERNFRLEYPDASDLEAYVDVTDGLKGKKVTFYISYVYPDSVPDEAYIQSPSGKKYLPTDNNSSHNGIVSWEMSDPEEGRWKMHLSANNRYGEYEKGVLETDYFREMFISHDETAYPHSMED